MVGTGVAAEYTHSTHPSRPDTVLREISGSAELDWNLATNLLHSYLVSPTKLRVKFVVQLSIV